MRSPYFPARTVLFRKEPNGVTYRVPALLFLSRSRCFLAFCEERLSPSDSEAHLLVMRKGTFYRNYVEVRACVLYSGKTNSSNTNIRFYCKTSFSLKNNNFTKCSPHSNMAVNSLLCIPLIKILVKKKKRNKQIYISFDILTHLHPAPFFKKNKILQNKYTWAIQIQFRDNKGNK